MTAPRGLLLLLAVVVAGHLPLLLLPPLNGDEAFVWEWARHLDWGYYSHPPMVAWLIALSIQVFGTTVFAIRLPSLLMHLGTLLLMYRIVQDLTASSRAGVLAVGLYAGMPIAVLLGTLITTDASLIFFWTATGYLVKRAIIDGQNRAWWLAGITTGGMLLSKFFALLFFPGLFLFLLFSPRHRHFLADWRPYGAFAIALLIFSPFLLWNAANGWLTFKFNLMARHSNEGLDLFKPLHYLAGQILAASPVLLPLLLVALWVFLRSPRGRSRFGGGDDQPGAGLQRDGLRLYAYLVAAPLAIFLVQSFYVRIGAHYAGVAFPLGVVLIVMWLHRRNGRVDLSRIARPMALWLGAAGAALISLPLMVVMLAPTVLPERVVYMAPGDRYQKFAGDYFGWDEVGARIAELRGEWGVRPEGLFFSTRDYSIASMLDFYTPQRAEFVLVAYSERDFHGKEFLYWGRELKKIGANTIYVSDSPGRPGRPHPITPYFDSVEPLPPLEIRDNQGRLLRVFHFTLGRNYRGGEPDRLN